MSDNLDNGLAEHDIGEVGQAFADLARIVHEQGDLETVCQALVDAAPRLVPGCDHASVMVRQGQGFRTLASSDDVAAAVDAIEREIGEGPCVDAIETNAYQLDADISVGSQWPALAERVLATTPVRGMAGYRLVVDGHKIGALDLFSDTPGGLTTDSADAGVVLSSFASVALAGATQRQRAETLSAGLASNREIGTAIGLLMAAHGLSAQQAFDTLRMASSQMNRKIASIAHEIVQQGPDTVADAADEVQQD